MLNRIRYIIEPFKNEWRLTLKYSNGRHRREWAILNDNFIEAISGFGGRIYTPHKKLPINGFNIIIFSTKENGQKMIDEWIEPNDMMMRMMGEL